MPCHRLQSLRIRAETIDSSLIHGFEHSVT
jgi:hypothetical protein